jgi:diguanylate cyclase (GGDEF)-like protein/PAS domain S-box-containing protein
MSSHLQQIDLSEGEPSDDKICNILVVDDVPTNRSVLKSLLTHPNYRVTEAASGKEALNCVSAQEFHLVILDVLMPGMNGIDVLRAIRKDYSETELPVLMLTVKDDIDDVVKALELGANDYITRPIDYSVLVARIKTHISHKTTQDLIRKDQKLLEQRIAERTGELLDVNRALRAEVAERKHAEEKALRSQERYRILYNDTPSMFFTLDQKGQILSVNRFGAEHLGYTVSELIGASVIDLYIEPQKELALEHICSCFATPDIVHRWESCQSHKNGTQIWIRASASVIDGEEPDGHAKAMLLVCEDVTEAHTLSEQLSYQATHDALTGLVNRREFEVRLQEVLEKTRDEDSQHALCYLDLDQFKIINDTCGHVAGDELLRQLGALLQDCVRREDTLARLGGDEFAVLMTNCSLNQAARVANALRQAIVDYRFLWGENSFSIAVSIGLVPISRTSESIAGVLSAADTACYAAKDDGRNRIHIYEENDAELARRYREIEWIAKINSALEEDRFKLCYQPIVPVDSENDYGQQHYELLVRMEDEKGHLIKPVSFLPAAERYKYSVRIDRWVVGTALDWLYSNPSHVEDLFLCSINLSGHSLGDEEFLAFVLAKLDATGVPAHKICFEVTETAAIANLSSATRFIQEIKERKCRFALDDFGSGLSSFAYLKQLPVDFIKIDGLFVRDIVEDPIDKAMVKSINDVAKVMDKQTIAEFVETQATLEMLRDLGVDYAQGHFISEPRLIDDLE